MIYMFDIFATFYALVKKRVLILDEFWIWIQILFLDYWSVTATLYLTRLIRHLVNYIDLTRKWKKSTKKYKINKIMNQNKNGIFCRPCLNKFEKSFFLNNFLTSSFTSVKCRNTSFDVLIAWKPYLNRLWSQKKNRPIF